MTVYQRKGTSMRSHAYIHTWESLKMQWWRPVPWQYEDWKCTYDHWMKHQCAKFSYHCECNFWSSSTWAIIFNAGPSSILRRFINNSSVKRRRAFPFTLCFWNTEALSLQSEVLSKNLTTWEMVHEQTSTGRPRWEREGKAEGEGDESLLLCSLSFLATLDRLHLYS